MRGAAIAALILLAGCADEARDAEREYAIAANTAGADGPNADTCAAAERVKAAYLRRHDDRAYQRWKLTAFAECHRLSEGAPS